MGDQAARPSGGRVLARRRRELILDRLDERGSVRVSELTDLLGVSDMTVRRDLDALAAAGQVRKVHGGATAPGDRPRRSEEPGFAAKSGQRTEEKAAIARLAAEMVRPGTAVGITAGTTTWHLARVLGDVADLIVVTNSVRVGEELAASGHGGITVMLTGGVRTPSDALVGPIAVQVLTDLHLDQVFMGVHGMTERTGFTTPNLMEAETNRAFVRAAERLVVLADHTKWGTVGLSTIAELRDAHALVTDDGLPAEAARVLGEEVGELRLATRDSTLAPVRPMAR